MDLNVQKQYGCIKNKEKRKKEKERNNKLAD
jgi:hypothetical protein